ncbi:MAG: HAD-IIIA family hydrolase [Gemmatimonadales bacterium]
MRRAAFLDRDGTIIIDSGFLRDPDAVELLPGAAAAIASLRAADFLVVVVTNQSGIARDLISWDEYQAVANELDTLLAEAGTRIDATYVCPHYPPLTGPCACRKPALGHYRAAAERFGIDLSRSLFVGDRLTDVEPARPLGGRGILVETGVGGEHREAAGSRGIEIVPDLAAAVRHYLSDQSRP